MHLPESNCLVPSVFLQVLSTGSFTIIEIWNGRLCCRPLSRLFFQTRYLNRGIAGSVCITICGMVAKGSVCISSRALVISFVRFFTTFVPLLQLHRFRFQPNGHKLSRQRLFFGGTVFTFELPHQWCSTTTFDPVATSNQRILGGSTTPVFAPHQEKQAPAAGTMVASLFVPSRPVIS